MTLPLCAWCRQRRIESRGALYCSHSCRQAAYLARRRELDLLDTLAATIASLHRAAGNLRELAAERQRRGQRVRKGGAE